MKKHSRKDNLNLLYGWERVPSISEPADYHGGVTYGIPSTTPQPKDRRDPAGLWNPPIAEQT